MRDDTKEISGADVNNVLMLVDCLSKDGDKQLSILAHAFVVACMSCQVKQAVAVKNVKEIFAKKIQLVPLVELRARALSTSGKEG